jgi:alpha-glucuronidase
MKRFADAFVQNADGSWFCKAPVEFVDPKGTRWNVTPGVTYRPGKNLIAGYDIAGWLAAWYVSESAPLGIDFPRDGNGGSTQPG